MSTSSDSSQLTEQAPTTQHFTLVMGEEGNLTIGLHKIHVEKFRKIRWSRDSRLIYKGVNPKLKKDHKKCHSGESRRKGSSGSSGGGSDSGGSSSSSTSVCSSSSGGSSGDRVKNAKRKLKKDEEEEEEEEEDGGLKGRRCRVEHDIPSDDEHHLKSTKLVLLKGHKGHPATYECQIGQDGKSIKRKIKITEEVLGRLAERRGVVLSRKVKDTHQPLQGLCHLSIPTVALQCSEEEDDDVVSELPRIPSRIFSRAPSVEDDDGRLGLTSSSSSSSLLPKGFAKRLRRDSESSDTTDHGDVNDENDDTGIVMKGRTRRMSSIDISKSAQQRLLKLCNVPTPPSLKSPEEEEGVGGLAEMELFKQKMLNMPPRSRRTSLAEIVPGWPKLERPVLENHHGSSSNVNKANFPHIKVDLEGLEMQQMERRKSFSVRSRRTSLADVIPDWPQLQKPKVKVENFLDELEDVVASENDMRIELSCRFTKSNCKISWFKDNAEIFPGQKYNFLQDDNGVIRLIIQRLCVQDSGHYCCQVNEQHETRASLTVEEKMVKYTFIRKMPLNVKVQRGKALQLECVLNDARGSVRWSRDEHEIEYTPDLYEISRRDQRCILRIAEVDKELEGAKFECSVYEDYSICHVSVEEPEYDFVRRVTDQDSYEKENVIFECALNYAGAPVKWLKNGKTIKKSDERYQKKVKGVVHRLLIKQVQASDQAVYSCEVNNKTSSARLFVSPDLVILQHLSFQSVLEHENICLKARVKNPKNITAEWMKDEVPLDVSNDRRMKIEVSEDQQEHTLTIRNACLTDAGSYSCRWQSRVSEADVVVKQCRLPPFVDLDHVPKEILVKAGKSINISFPYLGTPNPIAKWRKDGEDLSSDEHTRLHQYNGKCVLLIDNAERRHQGNYHMKLSNDCGETNVEIKIQVIGPPSAPQAPLEAMDIFSNKCHLKWNKPLDDGGLNIDKYVVEVYDVTKGVTVSSKSVKGDTQCSVDGLVEGHKYTFKVKACNAEGESDWLHFGKEITAKDPWVPPSQPGKPMIKSCDQETVELEWKPAEKDGGAVIQKYVLEKMNVADGEWKTVGMVPPTELCAIVRDLEEGEQYKFRVVAVNKAGRGKWSECSEQVEKKVKKGKEPDFETPLTNTYFKEGTDVKVKTKIVSDPWPDIKWYLNEELLRNSERVEIKSDQASGHLQLLLRNAQKEVAGLVVCDVTNIFGNTSSYAQLKILVKPSFKRKEVEIDIKQGDKHKEHIHFENAGAIVSRLSIRRLPADDVSSGGGGSGGGREEEEEDEDVEISTYEHNNYLVFHILRAHPLMNKRQYRVDLSNGSGTDSCNIRVHVTGCPGMCQGPLEVTGVTRNSCELSWKAPKEDGGSEVLHYEVMKKDQCKGYWSSAGNHTKGLKTVVENLVEGKKYFFKVAAVNQFGWGRFLESEDAVMAKLPFEPPEAPGVPVASDATSNTVRLTWKASPEVQCCSSFPERPHTSYLVQKFFENRKLLASSQDDHSWMNCIVSRDGVTCKGGECTCVVEGLVEERKYCFRVMASNQAGDGGISQVSEWVHFVDVLGPPFFRKSLETEVEAVLGADAVLEVKVGGCPTPSVSWYKDDKAIVPGTKFLIEEKEEEGGLHRLVVRGVEKEDGEEYMVKAINQQGSKTCRTQLLVLAAPKLQVPSMYQAPLVQDKGTEVVVKLYYAGHPLPSLTWKKQSVVIKSIETPAEEEKKEHIPDSSILSNFRARRHSVSSKLLRLKSDSYPVDAPASSTQHYTFEFTPRFISMKIWNVQASDKGDYEVEVANKYGVDRALIRININDVPGQPIDFMATHISEADYSLSWQEPAEDGGSTVTSYYVEVLHQQLGDERWMPYMLSRFTKVSLENLLTGKTYHFRVGASNVFGKGPPCNAIKIVAGNAESTTTSEHDSINRVQSHSDYHSSSSSSSLISPSSSSLLSPSSRPFSRRFSRSSVDRY